MTRSCINFGASGRAPDAADWVAALSEPDEPADPDTVEAQLLDSTAVAVVAGSREALPDVHQRRKSDRAARASWQADHRFRGDLVTRQEAELVEAVREHTVPMVECLRVALDETPDRCSQGRSSAA
jgi:hypothetical protein